VTWFHGVAERAHEHHKGRYFAFVRELLWAIFVGWKRPRRRAYFFCVPPPPPLVSGLLMSGHSGSGLGGLADAGFTMLAPER
jgi:hypothetical protein